MAKKQKRHVSAVAEKIDAPEESLDVIEEGDVAKKRMRRGDHLQRVLELVGMEKKEELCHHIPQKHCVIVSSFERNCFLVLYPIKTKRLRRIVCLL